MLSPGRLSSDSLPTVNPDPAPDSAPDDDSSLTALTALSLVRPKGRRFDQLGHLLRTYTRQYIPCQNIHGILGKFGRAGSCEGSIAVQRGTDSVRAGYRLGRLRAGSIAVYLVLK